ncbi:MAG: hypothetical protein NVS2B12_20240 [Ktedonobacteraceae bacterium]
MFNSGTRNTSNTSNQYARPDNARIFDIVSAPGISDSSNTLPGIGWFAREVLGKPLYPYQQIVGDAILNSVLRGHGHTFSVMFARQMGKNQLSAIIEAYLLTCMRDGTIIKAAPTFKPQVINSRIRLLSMLDNPLTSTRTWTSYGYMIGVAPSVETCAAQIGPRVTFFSAGTGASIVGATASLLLEIDEAQDVAIAKFDRDLRPMASTQNATTVLYGTAWSESTLLAIMRANNLEQEQRDGIQRHFEYDWRTLAAINPHYKTFVETELQRLGEDHLTIRTQYRLLPITEAEHLFNDLQIHLLHGQHAWECAADDTDEADGIYIAGMDVGGEERSGLALPESTHKRDSTVITIGKVSYNNVLLPAIQVVHQYWWTGKHYLEQYAETVAICERWGIRRLHIDRTGLGDVMASLLQTRLGAERVKPFHFTRPGKSMLTYQFLGLVNSGRLKIYHPDSAPTAIATECWQQLRRARYRTPGEGMLTMYVDPAEGHDDFLISLALCCEAIHSWSAPIVEAHIIKPHLPYQHESCY